MIRIGSGTFGTASNENMLDRGEPLGPLHRIDEGHHAAVRAAGHEDARRVGAVIRDQAVDQAIEVGDVVCITNLPPKEVPSVPSMATIDGTERRALGIHGHEAVRLCHRIEAGLGAHVISAAHAAVQNDDGRALLARFRRVHHDRAALGVAHLEGNRLGRLRSGLCAQVNCDDEKRQHNVLDAGGRMHTVRTGGNRKHCSGNSSFRRHRAWSRQGR
jgi:hypothetical protein